MVKGLLTFVVIDVGGGAIVWQVPERMMVSDVLIRAGGGPGDQDAFRLKSSLTQVHPYPGSPSLSDLPRSLPQSMSESVSPSAREDERRIHNHNV